MPELGVNVLLVNGLEMLGCALLAVVIAIVAGRFK